jgi:signal peptidase I
MVFLSEFKIYQMSAKDLLVVYLIGILLQVLPGFGLTKLFKKAGIEPWKAYIPFYNAWLMQEKALRPKYWAILQLVPVAGWFITMGIFIEFIKLFGKFSFVSHTLTALVPFAYFPVVGPKPEVKYLGPDAVKKHKKGGGREWLDAAVFAIVAATLIRTFVFEAYTIPTGSMEKTLLINDYLFVSKLSYGPRIPNTPLSLPFIHATLPGSLNKSYSELIKIPYRRWFESPVKRNDIVVFNFPAGDTMINKDDYLSAHTYYDECFKKGNGDISEGRKVILSNPEEFPLVIRPVDKRENYVKRCVAIAGDTLSIKEGVLHINSQPAYLPPKMQLYYFVRTKAGLPDEDMLKEEYDFNKIEDEIIPQGKQNTFIMLLTNDAKEKMMKNGMIDSIDLHKEIRNDLYPQNPTINWQVDNFGPIWIPKKGVTITIDETNYLKYERTIRVYENNKLERKEGKIFINDKETNQYTFKMNYYWMMGDNRHGSQDSRFWGFVPEDHVVGKPVIIWLSTQDGVRWKRIFKRIH